MSQHGIFHTKDPHKKTELDIFGGNNFENGYTAIGVGYALASIRHLARASIPVLVNRCSFQSVKNAFKLRCPSFLLESRYYVKHGSFQSAKKYSDFNSLSDSASQARNHTELVPSSKSAGPDYRAVPQFL